MKTFNRSVMASFVLAMSSTTALAEGMTLADVVTKTLDTHPEYLQSEQLVESARQGIVQAKAGYLPTVDLTLGVGYERIENESTINRSIVDPNRHGDADSDRQEATLTVTQMLFDGFATPARVERSRAEFQNQVSFNKEIAEKVAVASTNAFYSVLREQTNLVVDEQNLRMHKNYQKQIQRRVRSGKSNKADLEQVNSRVALAESQVVQREELLEQAKSNFFRQVGVEAENLIANEVDYALIPASLEEAVEVAYSNNPRIKSLEAASEASESSVKEAKAAYMPTVNLELSASRNQNINGIDKKDQSEQAMVRMRYNLFNGGADKARHLASIAERDAADQSLADTKRAVERDVRSGWYEYQLTSKRLASLSAQVRAAKATKIAYKSQFDVGQRTLLDVLDSEREYNSARITLQTAKLARDYSVYQLLALMGNLTDTFTPDEVILDIEEAVEVEVNEPTAEELALIEAKELEAENIEPALGEPAMAVEPELSEEEAKRFDMIVEDINNLDYAR